MGDVIGLPRREAMLVQELRIEIGRLRALLQERLMSSWTMQSFETGTLTSYVACDGCHKKVANIEISDFTHDVGCDLAGPDMSLPPEGDE